MRTPFVYHFEWDPIKARTNATKHKVGFRLATTVFRDPLALTTYDEEHSTTEERWLTLGRAEDGQYLVVIHTGAQVDATELRIRIISARVADRQEVRDYEEVPR
ncbi:MAG: BrnT family toxin [Sulfobacillus sp.]